MKLSELPKLKSVRDASKRLGRGHGSGKGKTSGRGTKGQKARESIRLSFEGGQLPLTKRLPFQRGKSRFNPLKEKPLAINLNALSSFEKGETVTLESLIKKGIINENDAKKYGVKILGNGDLSAALTVALPTSKSAAKKIEAAGGSVQASSKGK